MHLELSGPTNGWSSSEEAASSTVPEAVSAAAVSAAAAGSAPAGTQAGRLAGAFAAPLGLVVRPVITATKRAPGRGDNLSNKT